MIRRTPRRLRVFVIAALMVLFVPAFAQDARRGSSAPLASGATRPIVAKHGMVVAQEKIAARIGADVLARGGNAVDAAVATGFAMAVTYPRAGNIGGGGFMVIHLADGNRNIAIDYRETAPAATTRDIFLGADGKPDPAKSRDSALGIGVPGTVAGLALALGKYGSGKFSLADLLKPAITLARDGFVVTDDSADTLPQWHRRLAPWPSSLKIFSRTDGSSLREGDRLVQTDLAATLTAIADHGPQGFYEGPVASRLVEGIRKAGGIMTLDDLKGQPFLMNVWGSWCVECRIEHPVITKFAETKRLRVVGYNWKDEPADALRWLEQFNNPYWLVIADVEGRAAIEWGIYGAPETFLVDASGVIRWKHVGPLTDAIVASELMPVLERIEAVR